MLSELTFSFHFIQQQLIAQPVINISTFFIKLCKSPAESHFGLKVIYRFLHNVIRNELYVKPWLYCITVLYVGQDLALDINGVI